MSRAGAPGGHLLRDAEKEVGRRLPELLRRIFEHSVALRGSWSLPDETKLELPELLSEAVWGGLDLSVREVVAAEESRQGWVKECFPNAQDPYDVVWHLKFGFHTVANGDVLAVEGADGDGAVYYLSHDDEEGHGAVLAPSLIEFLDRWSRIGFVGPEDWLLLPFAGVGGLEPDGSNALAWRRAFGLHVTGVD